MSTEPIDIEKDRQNAEMSAQSSTTNAASANDFETENHMADHANENQGIHNLPEKDAAAEADPNDEGQYPHGLRLLCIVVALGMSIFLVALDMVRLTMTQRRALLEVVF